MPAPAPQELNVSLVTLGFYIWFIFFIFVFMCGQVHNLIGFQS